ncbi:MAG TPA: aminoacyl-tRNA hydrolase [Dehalococcoidia bacterium]|nr:aminoacyl-tRNA hydrolase [Dehalococcoidia bacterium]
MKLIVGLGNPGKTYARNRHNVGFRCISYLARLHSIPVKRQRYRSQVGSGAIAGVEVLLVKPRTFVNLSGEAVSRLMRSYGIPVGDLIVIYDDLDLPPGKLRLRVGGSAGGHKGVSSIISALGSKDFCRIKIGIGRPVKEDGTPITDENAVVRHVLGDFTPQEERLIKPAVARVAQAVRCILTEGITAAMNRFN